VSTPNLFEIRDTFDDLLQVGRMGQWAIVSIELSSTEDDNETFAAGICLDRQQRLQVAEVLTPHGALLEGSRTVEDGLGNALTIQIEYDLATFTIRPAGSLDSMLYMVEIPRDDALHAYELLTR
jgi:hypothetical protein